MQLVDQPGGEAFGSAVPRNVIEERATEEIFEDGCVGEGCEVVLMILCRSGLSIVQDGPEQLNP